MEIRVDGREATIQASARTTLAQIVGAVRFWAEGAGKTVCSLVLDGEIVTAEDLARSKPPEGEGQGLLEIRTLDRSAVGEYALDQAAGLLPNLRLDLAMAAGSIRCGETRDGLESLFRAISTLGSVEATLGALGDGVREGPEASPSVLDSLRGFLEGLHGAIRAEDLELVATLVDGEGPEVLDLCEERLKRLHSDETPDGGG